MYAFYTYKPTLKGVMCKQKSVKEILDLRYCTDEQKRTNRAPFSEKTREYIEAHRKLVHECPNIDPWMLCPVISGSVDKAPLILVQEFLAQTMAQEKASYFAPIYFERVMHCLKSKPEISGFGAAPKGHPKHTPA